MATATFVPTTTPHPTATPIPILFEDNFDKGLSEQWNIVYGNPLIVNEKLTADEETWIVVGDSSWTDYIVEFDMINSAAAWYNAGNNVLAVRVQDLDNMIAFRWATYESDWFIVESGKWNKIPNAYDNGIKSQSNLRIVVEGNLLTAYIGGNKVFSFVNTQFPTGGVALRIKRGAVFDNFVVKAIK